MLRIYANTWGNYNQNGANRGEWITLPDYDLEDTLEALAEKMGDSDPEWFVNDYEWMSAVNFGPVSENSSFNDLNELCETLEGLDQWELEKLEAILEGHTNNVQEALEELEDAIFYPGMDLEEVAEEIIEECYDLPEFARRYFDYAAFGRDLGFDGYTETSKGVICVF